MTKEAVADLTESAYFEDYTYTGANAIAAQDGIATSGSEQRKIPIAGDTASVHDQKVYVELRRPSIARSGNHTFEYLGFGPGNYSTGLPARQGSHSNSSSKTTMLKRSAKTAVSSSTRV